ncbi:MAG: prolipoprotein diacylglyceryl transferase [bacterium]
MFNFFYTFHPSPILFSIGPINIHWYGFFIALGFLSALRAAIYLAKPHNIKKETIIDLSIWLIIFGIIGARIYDVFLEWRYFSSNFFDIFKIWQGGLAIHGAIIGGMAAVFMFGKKYKENFWRLTAIIASVLPLGQAIGRWGNYFNQELFGYPTNLPWGIPITAANRPLQYINSEYFHPAFLYESLGNLIIFIILFSAHAYFMKKYKNPEFFKFQISAYLLLYSFLRFGIEFIRVDATPEIFGLRFPQLASLSIIFLSSSFLIRDIWLKIKKNKTLDN